VKKNHNFGQFGYLRRKVIGKQGNKLGINLLPEQSKREGNSRQTLIVAG